MAKLSRIPCETCKEETLHVGHKCSCCGAIFVSPLSKGWEKYKAHQRKLFVINGARRGLEILHAQQNHREYDKMMERKARGELKADLPQGVGTCKRLLNRTKQFHK
jgi:hypothetical protein